MAEICVVFVIIAIIAGAGVKISKSKMDYELKFAYFATFKNLKQTVASLVREGCTSSDTAVCPTLKALPKVGHNAEGTGFCDRIAETFNTIGTINCSLTTSDGGTFDDTTKNFQTTNGAKYYNFGADPIKSDLCKKMTNGLCATDYDVPFEPINTCDGSTDISYDTTGSTNSHCASNEWAGAKKACEAIGMRVPSIDEWTNMFVYQTGVLGTTPVNFNVPEAESYASSTPWAPTVSFDKYFAAAFTWYDPRQLQATGQSKDSVHLVRCIKGTAATQNTVKLSDTLYVDKYDLVLTNVGTCLDKNGNDNSDYWGFGSDTCAAKGMRLPTKAEATIMYNNRASLGLTEDSIWTSELDASYSAWGLDLTNSPGSFVSYERLKWDTFSRCVTSDTPPAVESDDSDVDNPSGDYYDIFVDISGARGKNAQSGSGADIMHFKISRNGVVIPVASAGPSIDRNYLTASVRYRDSDTGQIQLLLTGVTYKEAMCKAGLVGTTAPYTNYCNCPHEGLCVGAYTQDTAHCPLINNTCEVIINKPGF